MNIVSSILNLILVPFRVDHVITYIIFGFFTIWVVSAVFNRLMRR